MPCLAASGHRTRRRPGEPRGGQGRSGPGQLQSTAPSTGRHVTVTIPVRITVDIGDAIGQVSADQSTAAPIAPAGEGGEDDELIITDAAG